MFRNKYINKIEMVNFNDLPHNLIMYAGLKHRLSVYSMLNITKNRFKLSFTREIKENKAKYLYRKLVSYTSTYYHELQKMLFRYEQQLLQSNKHLYMLP